MRFLIFGLLFLSAVYFSESYSIAKRDTKDDLLKDAGALRELVVKEVDKLKAEGKVVLGTELEKAEKVILDLETELKNANPTTDLGKVALAAAETLLKDLETKVEAEVKKLSGSRLRRDTKDDLLKDAGALRELVVKELDKLKAEGKVVLGTGLEKAEKVILDLETELKNANPTTDLGKVALAAAETLLKDLETKVEAEVKKLSGFRFKRDTKDDLLKTITDLLTKAAAAVETLEKEGKPALVEGLNKSIKFLKDVETQLLTLKPTTDLGKALLEGLDQLIKQGEAALEADLKKAQSGF